MKVVFFVNNREVIADSKENRSLLDVIVENNFSIKYNCEGNGACGKCQVVIDKEHYDKMNISAEELDILEKQINSTATSRLACQVIVNEDINGAKIIIISE